MSRNTLGTINLVARLAPHPNPLPEGEREKSPPQFLTCTPDKNFPTSSRRDIALHEMIADAFPMHRVCWAAL
jgi:hypothetical protein